MDLNEFEDATEMEMKKIGVVGAGQHIIQRQPHILFFGNPSLRRDGLGDISLNLLVKMKNDNR